MNPITFVTVLVLTACGFFCVGALWGGHKIAFWRRQWINLEYDLANLQGRRPRDINNFEENFIKDPQGESK